MVFRLTFRSDPFEATHVTSTIGFVEETAGNAHVLSHLSGGDPKSHHTGKKTLARDLACETKKKSKYWT